MRPTTAAPPLPLLRKCEGKLLVTRCASTFYVSVIINACYGLSTPKLSAETIRAYLHKITSEGKLTSEENYAGKWSARHITVSVNVKSPCFYPNKAVIDRDEMALGVPQALLDPHAGNSPLI
ncbi:hypothetical protein G9A89_002569 [Geosiphon pyriformis]|nr:hypothetical protein G9A89_002569 [Geosiphon pyriformis]